jgi:hypothetical protein
VLSHIGCETVTFSSTLYAVRLRPGRPVSINPECLPQSYRPSATGRFAPDLPHERSGLEISHSRNILVIHCFLRMGVPPDIKVQSRSRVMEFLRTELSVALIFASLAEGQRRFGNHEAAKRSVADAERGYSALVDFFSEPTCAKLMEPGEQAEFATGLERLRKKLDSVNE